MKEEYSVKTCKTLEKAFRDARLHRPMRIARYEKGTTLSYLVYPIAKTSGHPVKIHLITESYVGGGFAGQVYRVRIKSIENGTVEGLEPDKIYAIKILVPPSKFSLLFRNLLYWIGFQGPFQLQSNPDAAKSGAIWQKFIRRGVKLKFGDEKAVNNIHATFIDENLGSCGEISDWVDGRTWKLEADDRMDLLRLWQKDKKINASKLGSAEYRAKKTFMYSFVKLLHEMGAREFARQYEWSTCKSQPNCLKRSETENDPDSGLVAVDFRAGLTLLPFLPMSPGDIKLIISGILRGSFVQFDRGNIKKLEGFIEKQKDNFSDMQNMLTELKESERVYRNSIPDIFHNHLRLLYSRLLWKTIFRSAVTGWKTRNIIDEKHAEKFGKSYIATFVFFVLGLIPFFGGFARKLWGRPDWRKHYLKTITSWNYFTRAMRGKAVEAAITWHREGRIDDKGTEKVTQSVIPYLTHLPLSFLPTGLHKFLTNRKYAKERLDYIFVRPIRLYFNFGKREEWLRDMVAEGRRKNIVTEEDAETILSKIKEPFIQKYLKSLAVHVCTVPVTQVVSVTVALVYVLMHPDMPRAQSWAIGAGIIALFQIVPISPGSLTRGLYVLGLVIKERNFKDYNIAVFLGFFKYIGYLAFPIQMTYRYPVLARFMAVYWATEAVHMVPVFGESGALLEHWVFRLFYNWPLTITRRMRTRQKRRAKMKSRYWHTVLYAVAASGIFTAAGWFYMKYTGELPGLKEIWLLAAAVPFFSGTLVTIGAGGAVLWKRVVSAVICGFMTAIFHSAASAAIWLKAADNISGFITETVWLIFIFMIMSAIGAIVTELLLPDPDLKS